MLIKKTNDVTNQYLNILIYGEPGTGKTTFGGTAENSVKTLFISAESGLLSLRNIKDKNGKQVVIDYIDVSKFEDVEDCFVMLRNTQHSYKCVVMDSITEIQKVCMDHILRVEGREKPQIQDWGSLNLKMERLIRAFRDLPLNFIATCLSETEVDQTTGEMKVVPQVQGKFQKSIAGYFDEVFYAYSKEDPKEPGNVKHFVLTRNSGKFIGKDRSGMLPVAVEAPTFQKIHGLIYGK